ncbi:hypothetical protein JRQ81_005191 [Phrynocephalus forsythii]|uniref:Hypocretin neuropeptide precursor n=1 Tax=Phrynocephalus forsythii TaxID=171643 RepID=A0A9Q1AVQ7_9SAUR|nr:hypothetical protein JRQ81_005191 [Phrynocephalus forsythii]
MDGLMEGWRDEACNFSKLHLPGPSVSTVGTQEGHDTRPPVALKTPKLMEIHIMKVRRVVFLFLFFSLCSLSGAKPAVPECCRQKSCSCRLFELLRGMGNHATGILTLGKRGSAAATRAFQSQLDRLSHSSGKPAAGILAVAKQAGRELVVEPMENVPNSTTHHTPVVYAAGPNPAGGCLVSLEKDSLPGPKTGAVYAAY